MKNERTSKRVAKIAAKILAFHWDDCAVIFPLGVGKDKKFTFKDIRALAASCLTQTADKRDKAIYDMIGYDPRDGSSGKPEKQRVPKQRKRKAKRGANQ